MERIIGRLQDATAQDRRRGLRKIQIQHPLPSCLQRTMGSNVRLRMGLGVRNPRVSRHRDERRNTDTGNWRRNGRFCRTALWMVKCRHGQAHARRQDGDFFQLRAPVEHQRAKRRHSFKVTSYRMSRKHGKFLR